MLLHLLIIMYSTALYIINIRRFHIDTTPDLMKCSFRFIWDARQPTQSLPAVHLSTCIAFFTEKGNIPASFVLSLTVRQSIRPSVYHQSIECNLYA